MSKIIKKTAGEISATDKIFKIKVVDVKELKGFNVKVAQVDVRKIKKINVNEFEGNDMVTIYTDDNEKVTVLPSQRINVENRENGQSIFTDASVVKGLASAINRKAYDELEQIETLVTRTKNDMNSQNAVIELALRDAKETAE